MINWLLRGIVGDHIRLTSQQRKMVWRKSRERFNQMWGANILLMLPAFAPLLLMPLMQHAQKTWDIWWQTALALACVSLSLGLTVWLFRLICRRCANYAIRELGFADICERCGYDLTGLDTSQPQRCPECGKMNPIWQGGKPISRTEPESHT